MAGSCKSEAIQVRKRGCHHVRPVHMCSAASALPFPDSCNSSLHALPGCKASLSLFLCSLPGSRPRVIQAESYCLRRFPLRWGAASGQRLPRLLHSRRIGAIGLLALLPPCLLPELAAGGFSGARRVTDKAAVPVCCRAAGGTMKSLDDLLARKCQKAVL